MPSSEAESSTARMQFSLWHLLLSLLLLSIAFALTDIVGIQYLASVPIGLAIGVVVGGSLGLCGGRSLLRCIGGGLLGVALAHLQTIVSLGHASSGRWSLADYVVLAPVGAATGAIVAATSSTGSSWLRPVGVGCLLGPLFGASWGCVYRIAYLGYFAFTQGRLDQFVRRLPTRLSRLCSYEHVLFWSTIGLIFGVLAGVSICLLDCIQRAPRSQHRTAVDEHSQV